MLIDLQAEFPHEADDRNPPGTRAHAEFLAQVEAHAGPPPFEEMPDDEFPPYRPPHRPPVGEWADDPLTRIVARIARRRD